MKVGQGGGQEKKKIVNACEREKEVKTSKEENITGK